MDFLPIVPTVTHVSLILLLNGLHHAILQPPSQFWIRAAAHFGDLDAPDAGEEAQDGRVAAVEHGLPDADLQVLGAGEGGRGLRHGEARIRVQADGELPAVDLGGYGWADDWLCGRGEVGE